MMRWIINVLVNALLLIVIAGYFDAVHVRSIGAAITASLILSILNMFVKPVLVILTLPVTVITLGLFLFIINAITLYMTASIMGTVLTWTALGQPFCVDRPVGFSLAHSKAIIEPMSRK